MFLAQHFTFFQEQELDLRECGFYSSPTAWNTIPSNLHDITDTSTLRKRLTSVLLIVLITD